MDERHREA